MMPFRTKPNNQLLAAILLGWLGCPLVSFSQGMWPDRSSLIAHVQKSKADTGRVHALLKLGRYYMLREYYLYKTGTPSAQLDSACRFAEQALHLSKELNYAYGTNEALLLKADACIRKNATGYAVNLVNALPATTRFRLLIILGRHYLFHKDRSQKNADSSLHFLKLATTITPAQIATEWQPERIHVQAMQAFITHGLQQSIRLYQALIRKISTSENPEREALLWHELTTLIPLREKTGLTRLSCFEKMHALYKKSGNKERQAWVLKSIADIHIVNGKLDLAELELLEVLALYKAIGYKELHHVYDLLAMTYRSKREFDKSIFYGLKAIEGAETTNDSSTALTFYGRLARMYRESGQANKSVEWYSKLLDKRLFQNGENVYKFRDAGFFTRELIKLKKEKEALAYMLDIQAKNKPIGLQAEASLVSSLAYCYLALNQKRQAETQYFHLIELAGKLNPDHEITANVYFEIGQFYLLRHQYRNAEDYLRKALNASERIKAIALTKDIHLMLYRADSGLGNWPSATKNLLIHKVLNDSIFNETKHWQLAELQVQYETAKKQKNIESLNAQNQLQRMRAEQADRTKNITLVSSVLLVIIIGLLFNRYLIKQRNNRELEAHQRELAQKNAFLETLNAEQDKLLQEKEWLLKEVHHRVKNNLHTIFCLLESQGSYLGDDALKAIQTSQNRIYAMSLIHQKLYLSEDITTVEMKSYLAEFILFLADSFEVSDRVRIVQEIDLIKLPAAQAIPLALIINESVTNAFKHAFPGNLQGVVQVKLNLSNDDLCLSIADNGIGWNESLYNTDNSLGIQLMKGLSADLGAQLQFEQEAGTRILLRMKYKMTAEKTTETTLYA